jgi:GTP pyrophosphokinase
MCASGSADLVTRARDFCIRAHAGQLRDDGRPYHTHPCAVADILREHGIDDADTLAAAYLHDVLEDTPTPRDRLAAEFGENVTRLVEELTNIGKPGRTFAEKHHALAKKARTMSDKAKLVKLADRLHNLLEVHVWKPERQQAYARVSIDLLEALKPWPCPALAERVEQALRRYLT